MRSASSRANFRRSAPGVSLETGKCGNSGNMLSFGRFSPLHVAIMQQSSPVFWQDPTLLHQVVDRVLVPGHIVFAIGVAFGNRLARVVPLLPISAMIRRGLWKWKIRHLECDSLIGRSD